MSTLPILPPTLDTYLSLITSEHNQDPKFMATVAAEVQPFVDLQATLYAMIGIFTPNSVGDQLDKVGVWVGANRNLATPLQNVYFSWGVDGLGWGEGTWLGPDDSEAGLTVLPDDSFQILVKLVIAMNHWDGTVPGAYNIWNQVMGSEYGILIQDNQDMTMFVVFTGLIESVVTKALITGGFFNLRPAGVRIAGFFESSSPANPVFGCDVENSTIAGADVGYCVESLV